MLASLVKMFRFLLKIPHMNNDKLWRDSWAIWRPIKGHIGRKKPLPKLMQNALDDVYFDYVWWWWYNMIWKILLISYHDTLTIAFLLTVNEPQCILSYIFNPQIVGELKKKCTKCTKRTTTHSGSDTLLMLHINICGFRVKERNLFLLFLHFFDMWIQQLCQYFFWNFWNLAT